MNLTFDHANHNMLGRCQRLLQVTCEGKKDVLPGYLRLKSPVKTSERRWQANRNFSFGAFVIAH